MKATVYIATSMDGFIARENGDLDWLPGSDGGDSEGEDYGYGTFMASVDVLVMGRHTYEIVRGFGEWPYGGKRVVVLSSREVQVPQELADRVTVMGGEPAEVVDSLSAMGAAHIYVDGGKTIQRFLQAGFIQELIVTTIPVLIGSGIPLFGPLDEDVKLRHFETRSFDSGLVQSRYEVLG